MSVAELVRQLGAAGATPEMIAIAVEALEATSTKRSPGAEACKRWRDKKRENDMSRHVTDINDMSPDMSPTLPTVTTSSLLPSKKEKRKLASLVSNVRSSEKKVSDADLLSIDDQFDRLWQAYPRRSGSNPKRTASLSFLKAVKAGADPEKIIAAAERFAIERQGEDPNFTPMTSTWLNQGRFEDETVILPHVERRPMSGAKRNGVQEALAVADEALERLRAGREKPIEARPIIGGSGLAGGSGFAGRIQIGRDSGSEVFPEIDGDDPS